MIISYLALNMDSKVFIKTFFQGMVFETMVKFIIQITCYNRNVQGSIFDCVCWKAFIFNRWLFSNLCDIAWFFCCAPTFLNLFFLIFLLSCTLFPPVLFKITKISFWGCVELIDGNVVSKVKSIMSFCDIFY